MQMQMHDMVTDSIKSLDLHAPAASRAEGGNRCRSERHLPPVVGEVR